jgi:sigma-B regulation protein RsbU (phosphoserine phosphatase)
MSAEVCNFLNNILSTIRPLGVVKKLTVLKNKIKMRVRLKVKSVRFFSIKTKLGIAFVGMTLAAIISYVLVAKDTFESDKIAYVFESQNIQLATSAASFQQKVEKALLLGKGLALSKSINSSGENSVLRTTFDADLYIQGIQLFDLTKNTSVFEMEKSGVKMPLVNLSERSIENGRYRILTSAIPGHLLVTERITDISGMNYLLRLSMKVPDVFPVLPSQSFLLISKEGVLSSVGDIPRIGNVNAFMVPSGMGKTMEVKIEDSDFLSSQSGLRVGPLTFVSFTPKKIALAALGLLFTKSLVFIAMTTFLTIILALWISMNLTKNLTLLTRAAEEVGNGNLDASFDVRSADEIGTLSQTFKKMIVDLKRLLLDSVEKTRMQAELETAKIVQDTLFPEVEQISVGKVQVTGHFRSASECGGDWWWYWQTPTTIFVVIADATGHGAPAALVTSAARSAFALIQKMPGISLENVAQTFNEAINQTAKGKITMSALILEIETGTGKVRFVNASHVPSYKIPAANLEGLTYRKIEMITEPISSAIGRSLDSKYVEGSLDLGPGERLLLLTDGITERKNTKDEMISERQFASKVIECHKAHPESGLNFAVALLKTSDDFSNGLAQDDDITLVVIDILNS